MAERAINKHRVLVGANLGQVDEHKSPIIDPKEAVDKLIADYNNLSEIRGLNANPLPSRYRMNGSSVSSNRRYFMEDIKTKWERYETALLELAFVFGNTQVIDAIVGKKTPVTLKEKYG